MKWILEEQEGKPLICGKSVRPILDSSDIDIMKDDDMDKFLEYAKEWTGCDNAEIICQPNSAIQ